MKQQQPSKLLLDICIVVIGVVSFGLILSEQDAFEQLMDFSRQHEDWELDEIFLTALISPLFLGWFSFRRWREAKLEVALRRSREDELIETQEKLSYRATHDVLTGLPNRILLTERLHHSMAEAKKNGKLLAVVFIDLDGFKEVNDSYGHVLGDQLLVSLATSMKRVFRNSDTIARFGGDEFVVILNDLTEMEDSLPTLRCLLETIAQPLYLGDCTAQVSASLGVTIYPRQESEDADQLIRQADQAMYQAKLEGKNRYRFFDLEKHLHTIGHHERLEAIRRALANQEFLLHYQPKVNMRSGEVIGVEALIRWQHPERGLLMPASFLPLIENHPLAVDLGEWVIAAALKQMKSWQDDGLDLSVSVNIDACQLMQADFVERLQRLLSTQPGAPPLVLEVLETSALEDIGHVAEVMCACKKLGVEFSLDDFGTGYSSLTYLRRLPATELKIDCSFVRHMLESPDDLSILNGILGLATDLNRRVIAEGVETMAQGKALLQLGCELGQGYGIAHPMPAADLKEWFGCWRPYPDRGDQLIVATQTRSDSYRQSKPI